MILRETEADRSVVKKKKLNGMKLANHFHIKIVIIRFKSISLNNHEIHDKLFANKARDSLYTVQCRRMKLYIHQNKANCFLCFLLSSLFSVHV
jgi:hypothetical protein